MQGVRRGRDVLTTDLHGVARRRGVGGLTLGASARLAGQFLFAYKGVGGLTLGASARDMSSSKETKAAAGSNRCS